MRLYHARLAAQSMAVEMQLQLDNVRTRVSDLNETELGWLDAYLSYSDIIFRRTRFGTKRIETSHSLLDKRNNTIPTGLVPMITSEAIVDGVSANVTDGRNPIVGWDLGADVEWLYDYQFGALLAIRDAGGRGILHMSTGCLGGDSVIECNRAGKSFKIKLRDLVLRFNGYQQNGPAWDGDIPTLVRSRDADGFVRLKRLNAAVGSGQKHLFEVVVTSGKRLLATADHRFLTKSGWARLEDIRVGSEVCVEGVTARKDPSKKKYYRMVYKMEKHPFFASPKAPRIPLHRVIMEAALSGLHIGEFVARVRDGKHEGLVFLDPNIWIVHHLDGDHSNNELENLALIRKEEHAKLHGEDGGWKHLAAQTVYEQVVSISEHGSEETFDLMMEDEPHNFLANGFVVHNSGKTDVFCGLCKVYPCHWLFIVHRSDLMLQTAARWMKYGGHEPGQVGDSVFKPDPQRRLTVATFQTLSRGVAKKDKNILALLADAEAICVDECHTAAAEEFNRVLMHTRRAYYRVGLSGTPLERSDKRAIYAIGALGPVVYRVMPETLINLGILARPRIYAVRLRQEHDAKGWQAVYKHLIVKSHIRNVLVLEIVKRAARPMFVFVKNVEHGKLLTQAMNQSGIRTEFIWGAKETPARAQAIKDLRYGNLHAIVCSVVFQEGIDVPELAAVVNAAGMSSSIAALQRIGRGMRSDQGRKSEYEVWEIHDQGNKFMTRHSQSRLRAYKKEGHKVNIINPRELPPI